MSIGIYRISNKHTGQMYIGQSINIENRFIQHKRGDGIDRGSYIDNAIIKWGKEKFTYEIIKLCPRRYLNGLEKYFIRIYNTYKDPHHYNLTPGGENPPSWKGRHLTDEHKKKISQSNKGKIRSDETRNKLSKIKKGSVLPEEQKKKISNTLKGRVFSDNHRKKISEAKKGPNNHNWKNYARINAKNSKARGLRYYIKFEGKHLKSHKKLDYLVKWFFENYPEEPLHIEINKKRR